MLLRCYIQHLHQRNSTFIPSLLIHKLKTNAPNIGIFVSNSSSSNGTIRQQTTVTNNTTNGCSYTNNLMKSCSTGKNLNVNICGRYEDSVHYFRTFSSDISIASDEDTISEVGSSSTSNSTDDSNSNIADERPSSRQERWDFMMQQFIAYREEHGDTLVPMEFEPNPQLGTWVDNQRQQYRFYKEGKQSSLNKERIEKLEKEDFVWDVHNLQWETSFNELVAYQKKFGDCNVPKNEEGYEALWLWTFTQRRNYSCLKSGKLSSMTEDRIRALEEIGFVWSIFEETWNQRLEELKKFKAYHGDCMVPSNFESNPQLAKWVDMQRTQYKLLKRGKYSHLTEERISCLEEVGFVWNAYDFKWNQRYEELENFKEINGHCYVPGKGRTPLYRWINRQKAEYQNLRDGLKSSLTEERKSKLIKIGLLQEEV